MAISTAMLKSMKKGEQHTVRLYLALDLYAHVDRDCTKVSCGFVNDTLAWLHLCDHYIGAREDKRR